MAGTGHPYDVINAVEAREFLASLAGQEMHAPGIAWLTSRQMLRHATGPRFTVPVQPTALAAAIAAFPPGPERDGLQRRAGSGGEIRKFLPDFFRALEGGFTGTVDWIRSLPSSSPETLRKLPKITPDQARRLSGAWHAGGRRAAAVSDGLTAFIAQGAEDRVWHELLDDAALEAESVAMHHCIREYAARVATGQVRVFSLRDPDGSPHVTLELQYGTFVREKSRVMVGQIKSFSNTQPQAYLRPDIAMLLNRVPGVFGDQYGEAARAGCAPAQDGRWSTLEEVSEACLICGIPSLGSGTMVFVPDQPGTGRLLARLIGPSFAWWRNPDLEPVIIDFQGENHWSPAFARSAAELANGVLGMLPSGASVVVNAVPMAGPKHAIVKDGTWRAWCDIYESVEIGGIDCYRHGTATYLSDDRGRLDIGVEKTVDRLTTRETYTVICPGADERKLSETEARRAAVVFNALSALRSRKANDALTAAGLKLNGGRWVMFERDAKTLPSASGEGTWRLMPHGGRLLRSGSVVGQSVWWDEEGRSLSELNLFQQTQTDMDDICSLLNENGIAPPAAYLMRDILGWHRRRFNEGGQLAHFGGAWMAFGSDQASVLSFLRSLGRTQFKSEAANLLALSFLEPEPGEAALLYAGHGSAYLTSGTCELSGDDFRQTLIRKLVDLDAHLTRASRRALMRGIAALVRRRIGRTRRPRGLYRGKDLFALVRWAATHRDLSPGFLDRALPWLLKDILGRHYIAWEATGDDKTGVDPFWLEAVRTWPRCRARDALLSSAREAAWWISVRVELLTPELAANALDTVEILGGLASIDTLERLAAATAGQGPENEWRVVVSRAESLLESARTARSARRAMSPSEWLMAA